MAPSRDQDNRLALASDCTRIARAAGASVSVIRKTIQGRATEVTPQLHERVRGVWEAWWDKTPPQRTSREREIATKARSIARRRNWCTPLGLDEESIDCIGYQPEHGWLPATGTGAAPNLKCPARPHPAGLQEEAWPTEEGSTMPFDPVPRQASEYQKGAAFGEATVMRQIDGGVPLDPIQETQAAAKAALTEAARTNAKRSSSAATPPPWTSGSPPAGGAARRSQSRVAGTRRRARART